MLDKSIPYRDILMQADEIAPGFSCRFPQEFSIKTYTPGDENAWAAIETSVGEFDQEEKARAHFIKTFLVHPEQARRRCFFALSPDGTYAGTCSAWFDPEGKSPMGLLHWFAVRPEFQGKGVGTALLERVMHFFREEGEFPVQLHTQTWSHTAIRLYVKAGFYLLKDPALQRHENDYEEAIGILRSVIPEDMLAKWTDAAK